MAEQVNIGERPKAPVLKNYGFELCDTTFTINGHSREDGESLRELFNGPVRSGKGGYERSKQSFYIAQLKFYGIPFNIKFGSLRVVLLEAVREGKCDKLPESIANVQNKMLSEYEPLRQKWEGEVREWEEEAARKKKQVDEAWDNCVTPQQRAIFDFDRFLHHHYLTDDGKPDPTKTPGIVEYPNHPGFRNRLSKAVPGLTHVSFTSISGEEILIVGWDREAVFRVWEEKHREVIRYQMRKQEEEWKEGDKKQAEIWKKKNKIQPHYEYLQRSATVGKEPPKSFELRNCTGSYIIRCDRINSVFFSSADLDMDISIGEDGTLIAAYDFSIIEGPMLLGLFEDRLDRLSDRLDATYVSGDEWYNCTCDEISDDESFGPPNASGKRAATAAPDTSNKSRKTTETTTQSVPRRVYFRMRGRDPDKLEDITYGPYEGYLDFQDNTCTKFAGLLDHLSCGDEHLGNDIPFEGYKVADEPKNTPKRWEDFSEKASKHANKHWFRKHVEPQPKQCRQCEGYLVF